MTSTLASTQITAAHLHRSAMLADVPGVIHGITRRVPGAGIADGNVGYSVPRDRQDAWRMRNAWLGAAGLGPDRIVVAHQVHGADVLAVAGSDAGRGADPDSSPIARADGLVTDAPGPVLTTLHADCMPILLCDPVKRVVGTLHAGWRGTTADLTGVAVRRIGEAFGSRPDDVMAYLGPAIGVCCYEVGADVVVAWSAQVEGDLSAIVPTGERWAFDLQAANRQLLERAGVPAARIEASGICTRCNGDAWFSHRGQGPHTGRYASFIALVDGVRGS